MPASLNIQPHIRAAVLSVFLIGSGWLLGGCANSGFPAFPFGKGQANLLQGKHPSGAPHYRVEVDSAGRKHGMERWWYPNGKPKSEAIWRTGIRDGNYRTWYPDSTLWYAGRDSMGVPVDTLRFWHSNGRLQSLSVFAGGKPVHLEQYDSAGFTPEEVRLRLAEEETRLRRIRLREEAQRKADSIALAEGPRRMALAGWVPKARASVETYWRVPNHLKRMPLRTTALIRVASTGAVLGVTWVEKGGSAEFDRRATQALAKVRRFPPLPEEIGTQPIELRYEFATPGLTKPRRKLQLREPEKAMEDVETMEEEEDGQVDKQAQ